jgi:uncharacterized protein
MISKIAILLFLVFNQFITLAQTKPELPPDFFEGFSYNLPKGFNYNDSAQLLSEVTKITAELLKWENDAENNYSISDSNELYFFLDRAAAVNSFIGNHSKTIDALNKCRQIRPSPVYAVPFRLLLLGYSNACLLHKDDGSASFREIYSKSLQEEYKRINPDFRNDIIAREKGNFNTASTTIYWKSLIRVLDQSVKNMTGKLDYDNAYSLLIGYQAYYQRKNYQPVIEKVLYAISPSKLQEQQMKIPMRDGIKLNAYVYTDAASKEKRPAIISLSPYPSGGEAIKGNVFAANGYIYVYVDTRGRRESEGDFMPYETDARDYYDIIDWVSKQLWCNGKVATSGGSYLGFAQWQAIRKEYKHPALKAINPMVSVGFGVDFPRDAHRFYPYILQWATYVSGKELNQALFNDSKFWKEKNYELYKKRIPFAKLDSVAGMPNSVFQKWVSHPKFDNYWQNILPSKKDYEAIDIPIFSITGYYDADQTGAMYYFNQHQKYGNAKAKDNHWLLIGPYEHGGAQWQPGNIQDGIAIEREAQIPIYKYVIRWFDWVLKGKQKPEFMKSKITYFETGNAVWKGTESFKKLTTDSLELFLTPAIVTNKRRNDLHSLSLNMPSGNSMLKYSHDIAMPEDSAYLFSSSKPFDDSVYMTSPYNMVFESEPLQKDIVVSDKILARLYVSLNVPDADFDAIIQEITPDEKDRNLAYGGIRVRYRNGGEKPQVVKTGEVVLLNFTNVFVYVKKISKGSKIRFIFQSTNNPRAEINYGFGGEVSKESASDSRIIEATIMMSKKYASKVVIPFTIK